MPAKLMPEDFGEPALTVAGFQLWIHGRQFPDATDRDDGNWLIVTAHCGSCGASVWAQGAILMTTDIQFFGEACSRLLSGETATAALDPLEPELRITIDSADRRGHLRARVEMTPNNLTQFHWMEFDIDQTYLPGIIDACRRIVVEYPIRGETNEKDA